jgi:hypothetical protein
MTYNVTLLRNSVNFQIIVANRCYHSLTPASPAEGGFECNRELLMLTIFALYVALARITDAQLFVLVMIIVLTAVRRLLDRRAAAMWAVFLTKDAAYGRVTESGVEYNEFFRSHSADWSQIRCVEHIADSGRIKIYLFGKSRPVQFGGSKQALWSIRLTRTLTMSVSPRQRRGARFASR